MSIYTYDKYTPRLWITSKAALDIALSHIYKDATLYLKRKTDCLCPSLQETVERVSRN